jgi:hypothetical protein
MRTPEEAQGVKLKVLSILQPTTHQSTFDVLLTAHLKRLALFKEKKK